MRAFVARWMRSGSFIRNVMLLTGGTAFAQGLAVLALPLLTRLYSPEDFGLLSVYVAVIGIVTVVSCFRYNIAIPLPEDDVDGIALLVVSLIAATGLSALLTLLVTLASEQTAALLGQPGLEPYLWMVPLGVFVASAYNALQYWASRKKRFGLVTRTRISRSIGGVGAQVGIGAIAPTPFGLLLGQMLYGGLGAGGLAYDLWRRDRKLLSQTHAAHIFGQASLFRRFPIWSVPEALFNTAGVQVPVILIAAVAGPEAGFLMLAMRVMGLPMGLVGSSVAQVFLAEAPEKLRDGTLSAFTYRTMWTLFKTGAPPLVAVGALSPLLFPLVFGAEWERAGWLVAWMTPWFVLQFVASPVSMVLHVTKRPALAMALQAFGLLLRVGPLLAMASANPERMSEVYALTGAAFYGLYILVVDWARKAKV